MLRSVDITRYIAPLREGSSLPALVEADDGREYVVKFRGAGHGAKALIAEVVVGEIGRALGLPVPEIVLATLPEESPARNRTTRSVTCSTGPSASTSVSRSSRVPWPVT
ncbi:MAG: HipA family kinase [Candidatus Limnocylindria bacterium]